jgi:hypothetical protein
VVLTSHVEERLELLGEALIVLGLLHHLTALRVRVGR